jgi:UDP-glucose 4-epimerase
MKDNKNKRIAIIGSTSPSGKSIAEELGKTYSLNLTYRQEKRLPEQFKNKKNIQLLHYDLENQNYPEMDFFKNCDIVIWTVHIKHASGIKQIHLNKKAIASFLSLLPQTNIRRFIYLSSGGSIYGPPGIAPISETHPLNPVTPYGITKLEVEKLLMTFQEQTGMELAILRPGNIYGEESLTGRSKGIIASYINSSLNNIPFTIIGNPLNIRDYIYIQDLVKAVKYAVDSPQKTIIWNVGSGIGHSVSYIMNYITELIHLKPSVINHEQLTTNEIPVNILNTKRIKQESTWTFSVSLEEGLKALLIKK